eukprot:scaffold7430_cov136-Isochrysis_galbana.AAC.2
MKGAVAHVTCTSYTMNKTRIKKDIALLLSLSGRITTTRGPFTFRPPASRSSAAGPGRAQQQQPCYVTPAVSQSR